MRVLIAEPEERIAKSLEQCLKKNRYSVVCTANGTDAWEHLQQEQFQVVLLDAGVPEKNSFMILELMRKAGIHTPVMLLIEKGENEKGIRALEEGADDYIAKNFESDELVARVKALSRRSEIYLDKEIRFGDVRLDLNRYTIMAHHREIILSNKEFQLMELFMQHPGFIYSTKYLMELVWGNDSLSDIDVVWTSIGYLRKKLKQLHTDLEIKNIRGAGYTLKQCL